MQRVLILSITVMVASPVAAQERREDTQAEALADALEHCRDVTDANSRLACYDRAAPALLAARSAGDVLILDREGMRRAKKRVFGFQLPKLGLFGDGANTDKSEPDVKEIESAIKQLRSVGNGLYVLTLADDTQWQTLESRVGFFPKAGQDIHIEAGILGSYNATISKSNRAVKVKRIR